MFLKLALLLSLVAPSGPRPSTPGDGSEYWSSGGWVLNYYSNGCTLYADYKSDVTLALKLDHSDDTAYLLMTSPRWESVAEGHKYNIDILFNHTDGWEDTTARGIRTEHAKGIRAVLDGQEFVADFARATVIQIKLGDAKVATLNLDGSATAVARLNDCSRLAFKNNPGDPFKDAASPTALAPPSASYLITANDYPSSAIEKGEQGRVAYRLTIGSDGRATNCEIRESSGSAILDSTTCRIMSSRGKFVSHANETFDGTVNWKLP